jgi:Surface-adhesin protein E
MLKSNLSFIGVISVALVLLGSTGAWGADWKAYGGTNDGLFYYDTENITHPSKNIIRFWHKTIFSEAGIREAVNTFGKDYENLDHAISLREINCPEKMIRSLAVTYYSNTGAILDSAMNYEAEWQFMDSAAIIESLYQRLCE